MATLKSDDKTIGHFAAWLSDGFSRPTAKFVGDMLEGIHSSRSLRLAEIARALGETCALHSTCNRLSRNLAHTGMAATIVDRILTKGAHSVKRDTRLVVHVYELRKPNARKMQYLRDASLESQADPDTAKAGRYQVCEILASNTGSVRYVPLLATFWSRHAPGYVSDAEEVLGALHRVLAATNGRGVVCMDRYSAMDTGDPAGDPAGDLVSELVSYFAEDPDIQFVSSLGPKDAGLVWRRQRSSVPELRERCEMRFGATIFKVTPPDQLRPPVEDGATDAYALYQQYFSATEDDLSDIAIQMAFGSLSVRHSKSTRPLSLIVMKTRHRDKGDRSLELATSYTGLASRKRILAPILSSMSAGDVIAAHRDTRNRYSPSDMQVLEYARMQLLMALLQAVLFFEAQSCRLKPPMTRLQPHKGRFQRDYMLPEDMARLESNVG